MTKAFLWDSSAVLAALAQRDANHLRAVTISAQLADEKRLPHTTNYLEAETHALLLSRLGRAPARNWLTSHGMNVLRATTADEERAREILVTHADKDWSLCDALSFALMQRRGIRTVFTFDGDFRQYGRFDVLGHESW